MPTGHRFTYWQGEDGVFVGFPEEFTDYWTQGATLDELRENIADLLKDLTGGLVPCARHSEELVLG
jgi:predicted RNase H-like HicB family nuclease